MMTGSYSKKRKIERVVVAAMFAVVCGAVTPIKAIQSSRKFQREDGPNLFSPSLGEPFQTSSLLSCVRECTALNTSSYSVSYNTNTRLCTQRSKLTFYDPGVIRQTGDLFYYTSFCNQTLGYQMFFYKTIIHCVFISPDRVAYNESRNTCQSKGGRQIVIDSDAKFEMVRHIALDIIQRFTWIGLNDQLQEGVFVWEDGRPLNETYLIPWRANNPDNANDREDCVLIGGIIPSDFDFVNDIYCGEQCNFICEPVAP